MLKLGVPTVLTYLFATCILFVGDAFYFNKTAVQRIDYISNEVVTPNSGLQNKGFVYPADYHVVADYISESSPSNSRTFVFPSTNSGYDRFQWWPYMEMPTPFFSLGNVRTIGNEDSPPGWLEDNVI